MPDLRLIPTEQYEPIQHDARLALAYAVDNGLPMSDALDIGQALGLIDCPGVDERPLRGHLKGGRLRAVPVDGQRPGAVGVS